jgi:hypothetical protein
MALKFKKALYLAVLIPLFSILRTPFFTIGGYFTLGNHEWT